MKCMRGQKNSGWRKVIPLIVGSEIVAHKLYPLHLIAVLLISTLVCHHQCGPGWMEGKTATNTNRGVAVSADARRTFAAHKGSKRINGSTSVSKVRNAPVLKSSQHRFVHAVCFEGGLVTMTAKHTP
jgi:hypothetical protein